MTNNELRPYENYKNIDLPWLSSIPSHWEVSRNKNVMLQSKSLVGSNHHEYKLLSLTLNGIIARDLANPKGKFPKEFDTYQIVNENDLVFCLFDIDETPRTVGISSMEGMITGAYTLYKVKNANAKFLYYYYLAIDNNKLLKPLYTGLRKVVNSDGFLRTKLPIPPRYGQDQIVKYLDSKIAKINKFIKTKKKLIETLKEQQQVIINKAVTKGLDSTVNMKPSEIEGIGDVPEHWTILMNRRIYKENCRTFSSNQETVLSLSQKEGIIPYEKMKERSLHTSSYENWKLVYENDLVLNRFKAHLGVFFSSKLRGIVTFHYGVFEPIRKVESKYFEHLYHTNAFRAIYAGRSNGMTVGLQNLSNQNFYKVYTLLPPYDEQVQIVKFIEAEIEKSNLVISGIERELKLVLEFKTRIISDVVMGRADVRNVVIEDIVEEFLEEMEIDEDSLDEDIPLEEDGDE